MSDKKLSELPIASAINPADVSVLVSGGVDYQFAFTTLLQLIGSNLTVGANISFGTTLPQNTIGKNGDVFINTASSSFAQKIAGAWAIVYTSPSGSTTDGTVLYGLGIPGSATGNNNDTYINTGTGIFYKKTSGTWGQVFSMQTGPAGTPGTPGTNGTNGINGNTILNGPTNPSNGLGNNGDYYINNSTSFLFGPKAAGAWPAGYSIIGPAGEGIASGGTTGQILTKVDNSDFNTQWIDPLIVDDITASTSKVYSSQKTADLVSDEATARTSADTTETTAREAADTTLQTNITSEATAREAADALLIPLSEIGANNGVASLDAGGKVPFSQLPSSLLIYKGVWNPSTNTPTLADGTGTIGWVYKASANGTVNLGSGNISFLTGDFAIHNGTNYERSVGTDNVVSVNGQQGVVVLDTSDVSEVSNLYFTVARVLATLLSGISFGTVTAITATDSILGAFGKLQAQLNALSTIFQAKEDQSLSTTDNVVFAQVTSSGHIIADVIDAYGTPATVYLSYDPITKALVSRTAAQVLSDIGGGVSAAWGGISGTLSSQTDLSAALAAKAPITSPALTGTPTAPTPTLGDNTTKIATTAFTAAALIANNGKISYNFYQSVL